jgi:hypothetical protein
VRACRRLGISDCTRAAARGCVLTIGTTDWEQLHVKRCTIERVLPASDNLQQTWANVTHVDPAGDSPQAAVTASLECG